MLVRLGALRVAHCVNVMIQKNIIIDQKVKSHSWARGSPLSFGKISVW
jgi:hypothetical protein